MAALYAYTHHMMIYLYRSRCLISILMHIVIRFPWEICHVT